MWSLIIIMSPTWGRTGINLNAQYLYHNLSHIEHLVQAAPRISGNQLLDPDELHHPHGHGGLPEGVALVGVEPALHDENGDSIEETDQKTTNVTFKKFHPLTEDFLPACFYLLQWIVESLEFPHKGSCRG